MTAVIPARGAPGATRVRGDGGVLVRGARPGTRQARLGLGLFLCVALLGLVILASLAVGTKEIPLRTVVDAVFAYDPGVDDHIIVSSLRLPRTVIGLLVGIALGLAGALMQGLTRNPLADPGILGVSAGASLFVVGGIYLFGVATVGGYVWFAFAGAAITSVAVYAVAALGREGPTPVKLALSGTAITALLGSVTTAILLIDVATLDQYRFWAVGSLAGRDLAIATGVAPFIVVGTIAALATPRLLNALSLGDDVARSLGQRVTLTRVVVAVIVVALVGAAVAAAGPIGFVGLAVPHIARALTGPDYRWIVPYSAVLAPVMLLGADIIGRVIARPGEVQVGIVTALLGAPFFIALVRRRKLAEVSA